jgi:hypothetical protein
VLIARHEHKARHEPGEQEIARDSPDPVARNLAMEEQCYGHIQGEAHRHSRKARDPEIPPREAHEPRAH